MGWVLIVAAIVRRRHVVVGQAVTALALAALVAVCTTRLGVGTWPDLAGATIGSAGAPRFPTVWVAEAMAVVLTISPHLVRPLQVLGRRLLALAVVGAAIVAGGTPSGTLAAVLIAVVVAAGIRLAWGTSIGRPGLGSVAAGLAELGVEARDIDDAERQVAGVYDVRAVDRDGRPLLVKVYGRDAYDTQLIARLWRTVWYRRSGPAPGPGRLQAAEHEAFVTLLAANGGVPTRAVVTAGATLDDDALLVLRGDADPFAALDAAALQALGQEARGERPLDAVARGVQARAVGAHPALAGRERHDPAADPALGGEADIVEPIAGGLVQAGREHDGERVVADLARDDPVAGHRIDAAVGERRAHHREVAGGALERALAGVQLDRVRRIAR
jgi:hypothetical protein